MTATAALEQLLARSVRPTRENLQKAGPRIFGAEIWCSKPLLWQISFCKCRSWTRLYCSQQLHHSSDGSCSSHQHLALIPPCSTIAQAEAAVPPTPVSGCVAMSPRRDEPAAAGALHLAYNQSWHLHGNSSRCCIPNGSQGTATLSQAAVAINFCLGHLQGSKRIMQEKLIRGIETTLNSVIASTIPRDCN